MREIEFIDYVTPKMTGEPSKVSHSQILSTVNGHSFIPLATYAVNIPDMPSAKEFGFNLIQSYQFTGMSIKDQTAYLDAAKSNGLMVFVQLDGAKKLTPEKVDEIKSTVLRYKDHPAVYAWYLADEPSIATDEPANLNSLYKWIKNADPNHQVISSNWELWNFKYACDLDMPQLYNGIPSRLTPNLDNYIKGYAQHKKDWVAIINSYDSGWSDEPGRKSMNPTSAFEKLASDGFKDGDPEWETEKKYWQPLLDNLANPESVGFYPSKSFPNTPEAIRSSFYWAFVHGSNGVYYWLFTNPDYPLNLRWGWHTIFYQPRLANALKNTLGELKDLSKFLVNPSSESISFKDNKNPGMYVWSKIVDKIRAIIIINETGEEYNGEIDLSSLNIPTRTLKVYNEDEREIKLENGILKDYFSKEEVHVYFVLPTEYLDK